MTRLETRRPKRPAESKAFDELNTLGYTVCRRGYPDFMALTPDGNLAFVEVKPQPSSELKPAQALFLAKMVSAGIDCFTYNPISGFRQIEGWEAAWATDRLRIEASMNRDPRHILPIPEGTHRDVARLSRLQ